MNIEGKKMKEEITKITYSCGCIGEIFKEVIDGISIWKSDKEIVCPHT